MKVTEQQKQETRRKIIASAADLFVLQGYDQTSMKQIAREAGIGDATIYKYFPNKDKLIIGFYEVRAEQALEVYTNTEELETYSFQEKLQVMTDTLLEQFMADREFVSLSLNQLLRSPVSLFKDQLSVHKLYKEKFEQLLEELEQSEEYPEVPMRSVIAGLLTDYLIGIVFFWMKDDSEEFVHTTQLVDMSVGLIDSLLKSGLVNKSMEMVGFIIKTQLLRFLSSGGSMMGMLQEMQSTMKKYV